MRIPLGVIAIVYESRPNVTADAAALCLKAGNAVVLRGGSEAIHSNRAIAARLRAGLEAASIDPAAIQLVDTTDRRAVGELLRQDDLIDLVIPRGGESLIRFVVENTRIPVIKHYKGVCHTYVDASAYCRQGGGAHGQRQGPAAGGVQRHRDAAGPPRRGAVPAAPDRASADGRGSRAAGLRAERGDPGQCRCASARHRGRLLRRVPRQGARRPRGGFDRRAIEHIQKYGSDHTETIVTESYTTAMRFLREVNSSTVLVNASTRFADGFELGLGAEIGISTTKLHAFGPMGARELTAEKFVVFGDGQVRT